MSTKRERSNRDDQDPVSDRAAEQNAGGQGPTRDSKSGKAARERDGTADVPRKPANKASKSG